MSFLCALLLEETCVSGCEHLRKWSGAQACLRARVSARKGPAVQRARAGWERGQVRGEEAAASLLQLRATPSLAVIYPSLISTFRTLLRGPSTPIHFESISYRF